MIRTARVLTNLAASQQRHAVLNHSVFQELSSPQPSVDCLEQLLQQWLYVLHNFPMFLGRVLALSPDADVQTYISEVLWQELGQGQPHRSHESLFLLSAARAGFANIRTVTPLPTTAQLLKKYKRASSDYPTGLAWFWATELIDHAMVERVGSALRAAAPRRVSLPWVDAHRVQEGRHVRSSGAALATVLTADSLGAITAATQDAWSAWCRFFDGVTAASGA